MPARQAEQRDQTRHPAACLRSVDLFHPVRGEPGTPTRASVIVHEDRTGPPAPEPGQPVWDVQTDSARAQGDPRRGVFQQACQGAAEVPLVRLGGEVHGDERVQPVVRARQGIGDLRPGPVDRTAVRQPGTDADLGGLPQQPLRMQPGMFPDRQHEHVAVRVVGRRNPPADTVGSPDIAVVAVRERILKMHVPGAGLGHRQQDGNVPSRPVQLGIEPHQLEEHLGGAPTARSPPAPAPGSPSGRTPRSADTGRARWSTARNRRRRSEPYRRRGRPPPPPTWSRRHRAARAACSSPSPASPLRDLDAGTGRAARPGAPAAPRTGPPGSPPAPRARPSPRPAAPAGAPASPAAPGPAAAPAGPADRGRANRPAATGASSAACPAGPGPTAPRCGGCQRTGGRGESGGSGRRGPRMPGAWRGSRSHRARPTA